ncbi:MAG: patatin family protein [Desulfobacterales bacterium]|jgi:predicted patatin/cPLA2 family phospholipase
MKLVQGALILEGGGLRGNYTAGVLRLLMERGVYFSYVIGVSIGACNGSNYVSRQPERNRIVNTRFVGDPRFMSYRRLLRGGELFGMDFIFNTLPNLLVPFDFKAFRASPQRFIVTATDCETGRAVYYDTNRLSDADLLEVLKAGCSLPFLQKPVCFDGRILMDGGVADAVPLEKSIAAGNRRHVLVLTQPAGYRKTHRSWTALIRLRYPRYRGLKRAFHTRARRYNLAMARIARLEAAGAVFVIRPAVALRVKRTEKDGRKLAAIYRRGYGDAADRFAALKAYMTGAASSREDTDSNPKEGHAGNAAG